MHDTAIISFQEKNNLAHETIKKLEQLSCLKTKCQNQLLSKNLLLFNKEVLTNWEKMNSKVN